STASATSSTHACSAKSEIRMNAHGLPASQRARSVYATLRPLLGERLLHDPGDLLPYSYDNSRRQALPDLVAFADSHDEVVALVRACHAHELPLVTRGLGSGTAGAAVPVAGGLVLALERMNRIVRVDAGNRVAVVEP